MPSAASAWQTNWSRLPAGIQNSLSEYALQLAALPGLDYFPSRLLRLCQECRLIYAALQLDAEVCFEFGRLPEGLQRAGDEGGPAPGLPGLVWVERQRWRMDQSLRFSGLIASEDLPQSEAQIDLELLRFASDFLFHDPSRRDPRMLDLAAGFELSCRAIIAHSLENGKPVTLAHFEFPGLAQYMELAGEARSRSLMQEIIDSIRQRLKKDDYLVQPGPGAYVTLLPGATVEQIHDRFQTIYFHIKNLVLDYRLHLTTVDRLPIELHTIWKELQL